MAAAIYLNRPHEHEKWTCGVPEKWQQKWQNVTYFTSSPESINCDQKTIKLMNQGPDAGKEITYKSLVVATGQKSPLLAPRPGMSLSERVAEVKQCGEALKNAKTVIFNGAGLVGLDALPLILPVFFVFLTQLFRNVISLELDLVEIFSMFFPNKKQRISPRVLQAPHYQYKGPQKFHWLIGHV